MNKIVKWNIELMSLFFVVVATISSFNWNKMSIQRQMIVVFMFLYTLHEWEESKFPGGFYKIFFSKCNIDPTVSEERMHLPVAVYLLIILFVPYLFDQLNVFVFVPLILALFEGFIHTVGIIIHQLKKPYSPGMITAWIMFVYSIVMINRLNSQLNINIIEWIAGVLLTIISFFIMETRFLKTVGITIKVFQTTMKNHIINQIKLK